MEVRPRLRDVGGREEEAGPPQAPGLSGQVKGGLTDQAQAPGDRGAGQGDAGSQPQGHADRASLCPCSS